MSQENRYRVDDILQALKTGLSPYVLQKFEKRHNQSYLNEIASSLYYPPTPRLQLLDNDDAKEKIDAPGWLKLMAYNWKNVFREKDKKKEEQPELNHAHELLNTRNLWGHQKHFTNDDVLRVADTATRLLETIGAKEEAKVTREIKQEYGQLIFAGEKREFALVGDAPQSSTDSNGRSPGKNEEDQIQGVGNEFKQSGDSSSDNSTEQATAGKVGGLEKTSHTDDAIQQLIRQHHYQHQEMMQQLQTSASAANVSQPVININPTISPNVGDQVTYAPSAQTTGIAEHNNAAFVVGVLGGLFGLLGISHIFNHKVLRGLVYLFVGTVCYWIFLLFLFSALINIGSSLWIAAVAIHLVIIWQHAKRGAGSASANQTKEPKRK